MCLYKDLSLPRSLKYSLDMQQVEYKGRTLGAAADGFATG